MSKTSILSSGAVKIVVIIALVVIAGGAVAFQPITRNVVAVQEVCLYCHVEQEYVSSFSLSPSQLHPIPREDRKEEVQQARCVECHLPEGFFNTVAVYTHFAQITDLFGSLRDRKKERAGDWLPARQVAAYRVRDRLLESDSATCRSCHIESEIKPRRERGVNAHEKALKDKQTCIECHQNERHGIVEIRDDFGKQAVQDEDAAKTESEG